MRVLIHLKKVRHIEKNLGRHNPMKFSFAEMYGNPEESINREDEDKMKVLIRVTDSTHEGVDLRKPKTETTGSTSQTNPAFQESDKIALAYVGAVLETLSQYGIAYTKYAMIASVKDSFEMMVKECGLVDETYDDTVKSIISFERELLHIISAQTLGNIGRRAHLAGQISHARKVLLTNISCILSARSSYINTYNFIRSNDFMILGEHALVWLTSVGILMHDSRPASWRADQSEN